MAVDRDAITNTTDTSAQVSITTASFTVSGENRVILVYSVYSGATVASATAAGLSTGGGTLALIGATLTNGGTVTVWVGVAPTTGSQTATVTWNNADCNHQMVGVITFTGAHQTLAQHQADFQSATGSSPTAPSLTVPNVAADDFVADALYFGDDPTAGPNQTDHWSTFGSNASTQDGADGGVMSWSNTGAGAWAHMAFRIVAAAEGGGGLSVFLEEPIIGGSIF